MQFWLPLFFPFLISFGSEGPVGKQITGTVRIIRANPQTEVFFKDLKESVIIPRDSKHNLFFEACEESRKKGTPVQLTIDPISRQVLSMPEKTEDSKPGSPADSSASDAKTSSSGGQ